jgi:probable rRNA maturation factor
VTLAVAVAADGVRIPVSRARVRAIALDVLRAEGVREALVSLAFVTTRAIASLNRRHLGRTGPTDVIAFGFSAAGQARPTSLVGDIYIAPGVARRNARAFGVGVREELARLVVHGVLHVIGHDHPAGDDRSQSPMWRRQEALLRRVQRSAS